MIDQRVVLLERAIEVFHELEKPDSTDYMQFLRVVDVVKDHGLCWSEIDRALKGIVNRDY